MDETLVTLVVGAGLALAGALAQAFVARSYSRADRRRELLIEAYSDYLSGIAQRVAILEDHSPRTEAATALIITGKQKITAYAPASVVLALAAFEKTSQRLSQPDAQTAMIALVQAMRSSVGVESAGLEPAIHGVLFGGTRFVK
jgi:hypothetical protein